MFQLLLKLMKTATRDFITGSTAAHVPLSVDHLHILSRCPEHQQIQ